MSRQGRYERSLVRQWPDQATFIGRYATHKRWGPVINQSPSISAPQKSIATNHRWRHALRDFHLSRLTSHLSLFEIPGLFHGPFCFVLIQLQGLLERGFAGYETGDVLTDGGA